MNARPRRALLAGFGALAAALATAALAWACVPQSAFNVSPSSGPPGTRATASSDNFPDGPVNIMWEQRGSWRKLGEATAAGRRFSTSVTIPTDASPGDVHYLRAEPVGCEDHNCHAAGVAAFCVTSAAKPDCNPAPTTGQRTASRRARAIAKCKKRYRGSSRRAAVKRKSCIAKAKRRYRA